MNDTDADLLASFPPLPATWEWTFDEDGMPCAQRHVEDILISVHEASACAGYTGLYMVSHKHGIKGGAPSTHWGQLAGAPADVFVAVDKAFRIVYGIADDA